MTLSSQCSRIDPLEHVIIDPLPIRFRFLLQCGHSARTQHNKRTHQQAVPEARIQLERFIFTVGALVQCSTDFRVSDSVRISVQHEKRHRYFVQ